MQNTGNITYYTVPWAAGQKYHGPHAMGNNVQCRPHGSSTSEALGITASLIQLELLVVCCHSASSAQT